MVEEAGLFLQSRFKFDTPEVNSAWIDYRYFHSEDLTQTNDQKWQNVHEAEKSKLRNQLLQTTGKELSSGRRRRHAFRRFDG